MRLTSDADTETQTETVTEASNKGPTAKVASRDGLWPLAEIPAAPVADTEGERDPEDGPAETEGEEREDEDGGPSPQARDDTGGVPAEEQEQHTERAAPLHGRSPAPPHGRERTVRTSNSRRGNPERYKHWLDAISIVDKKAATVTKLVATARLETEAQNRANAEERMYYLYQQSKIGKETRENELVKLKSIKRYESRMTERRSGVFNRQTVLQQARNRVVV
mmetsp:Transcript_19160/g.38129  ORF Transcript_19160/g.38129 Transcript_19160/m.38129 type:complete len:222 (+) Transcript_19160:2-667(+)